MSTNICFHVCFRAEIKNMLILFGKNKKKIWSSAVGESNQGLPDPFKNILMDNDDPAQTADEGDNQGLL